MKPGLAVPGPRLHHHLLHVAVGVEELADTVGNIVLEIFIFINVMCPSVHSVVELQGQSRKRCTKPLY